MFNEIKIGYKKTRIGYIPEDWKIKKIKDFCEIVGGGTPSTKNDEYWIGDMPWISSSDLKEDDVFYINKCRFISKKAVEESATNICPKDSILLVSRVGIGKIAISSSEICTSQDFTNIIKYDADKIYLLYTLYMRMKKEVKKAQGTSIKGITVKELENFEIPLPDIKEQQKIAEILSTQDKVIELKEKLIEEKQRQKKYLMQQLLTEKKRLKGFNGEWENKQLGDLCDTYSGGTPNRKKIEYFNGDIPWIKSGELNQEKIYDTEEYITKEALNNSSAKMVKEGTLLIAMYGATAGVIAFSMIDAAINQAILALVPKTEVNMLFLKNAIQNQIEIAINKLTQGGQPNFNAAIIKSFNIILPSIKEQTAIAEILSTADKEIDLLQKELEQEKQKKKALMQLLLTGIVRV